MPYRADLPAVRWLTAAEACELAAEIRRSLARPGWLRVRVRHSAQGAVYVELVSRMSGVEVQLYSRADWHWLKRSVVKEEVP